MKYTYRFVVIAIVAQVAIGAAAWGDEPAKTNPSADRQSESTPAAQLRRLSLDLLGRQPTPDDFAELDLSVERADLSGSQFLVDLSSSLVAGNGLGIDVSPPEAALRAQLGI